MSYQIEIEDKSSVEKALTISIDRSAFEGRYQKQLGQMATRAQLKGFRPGKAPKEMVSKSYGSQIYNDVLNGFINEALREAISKNNIPVIDTEISKLSDLEKSDVPVTVNMLLSLYPDPKLEKYKDLSVEYNITKFEDKVVDNRVDQIRGMFAEIKDVSDRTKVFESDIVSINYEAYFEDKKDDNLSASDQIVELGKNQLPKEIEAGLFGAEVGVKNKIKYTFPETATDNLKNKEYELDIEVTKIQAKELPIFDDEFAKKTGMAENVEGLREFISKQAKRGIDSQNKEARDTAILDAVIKENNFEVPRVLVDREIRQMLAEMRILNPKDKNFNEAPVDDYRHIMSEKSTERVKRYIVLEALLKAEEIDCEVEDVEKFLDKVTEESGMTREQVNSEYNYPKQIDGLKRLASVTILFDRLAESSKLTEKEVEEKEQV
jgi:trigger factor